MFDEIWESPRLTRSLIWQVAMKMLGKDLNGGGSDEEGESARAWAKQQAEQAEMDRREMEKARSKAPAPPDSM